MAKVSDLPALAIRYARSDHTIPVPRPEADAALGIRNACQTCHVEAEARGLERQAREWWGTFKPRPAAVDALLRLRAGEADALDEALDSAAAGGPVPARAMALGVLVTERLAPDMPDVDEATIGRLRSAAESGDPDVAALGLAGMHLALGTRRDTRQYLADRLAGLGETERAIRARWTLILGSIGDNLSANQQLPDAIAVYGKALDIEPDNAAVLLSRGIALAAAGDRLAAEADYRRSIMADSLSSLAWVNLGIARAAQGDAAGAVRAYQQASRVDPHDPLPWFNLGNLFLRANRYDEAIDAYRRAIEYGPGLAAAHFNLARALILTDRPADARMALRDGLQFEPGDEAALMTIAQIDSLLESRNDR